MHKLSQFENSLKNNILRKQYRKGFVKRKKKKKAFLPKCKCTFGCIKWQCQTLAKREHTSICFNNSCLMKIVILLLLCLMVTVE